MLPFRRQQQTRGDFGALKTISAPHENVHQGITFQASYKSPDGAPVADDGSVIFLVIVGTRKPNITFRAAAGGDAEVLFYEGTQVSDNGTPLQSHNMKRTGTMTPSTAVYVGPTVSENGLLIHNSYLPGGLRQQATGGEGRSNTEWILKPSTNYIIQAINRSGGGTPMSLVAQWYEEDH
jgi:hypothetical protein